MYCILFIILLIIFIDVVFKDMTDPKKANKELTMEYFFLAKKSAMPTWPLMGPNTFYAFIRRATRVCVASDREGSACTAVALGELLDIAVRVERNYRRRGIMGPNDIRFKAHMYLHLQYASILRTVFVRASALAAFEGACKCIGRAEAPTLRAP